MLYELVERRLAAILAADVVGYTRLMETNEELTLSNLRKHRREFFDPLVKQHGGRIFKVMGDGVLIEFASVLNAARCAAEIQRGMPERNTGTPEDRHFKFRMGINLGDIIVDGEDVHGDGVNLAVRLQTLAPPGGIACSAAVRNEVANKLELYFSDQGEKQVKNLANPVRVYFADWHPPKKAAVAGLGRRETASVPYDRPSLAVLPFANLSNDPEQEFFSDGITEDIITDMSNVSGIFVLSRNTVFAYKGRAQNLERIARELGVAYVVEGSVRKASNRVRINAELVEGATDGQLWAARYDRDLTDIFAVQDDITKAIVEQLKVKLLPEEKKAIEQAPTESVEAYTYYLRAREYYHISSRANHLMARRNYARAIEIDPNYARCYAGIAVCDSRLRSHYGVEIPVDDILATTDKALNIDPNLAEAHAARGFALAVGNRRDEAIAAFKRALELDPNCHEANRYYGEFCVTDGNFERAAQYLMHAMTISPGDYGAPLMLVNVFRSLRQPDKAESYARIGIRKADEQLKARPEDANAACLGAIALAFIGERDKALEWLAHSLATAPGDTNVQYNAACTYCQLGDVEQAISVLEGWLPQVGLEMKRWFLHDSDLDPIRRHPRYVRLEELSQE